MNNFLKRKTSRKNNFEKKTTDIVHKIPAALVNFLPSPLHVESTKEFLLSRGYKLGKLLGNGSSGIVHSAESKKLFGKKDYAIKIQLMSEEAKKEARFTLKFSQLSNQVIKIKEAFEHSGLHFIVFELASQSLCGERLSELEIAAVLSDICNALNSIHGLYVHNDIKPSNIMIVRGEAKLADFGTCTVENVLEHPGGTRGFQCPEYSECKRKIPPHSSADIWSLGITMISLSGFDIYEFVSEENNVDCEKIKSNFSEDFSNLLLMMTQYKREDRATLKAIQSSPFLSANNVEKGKRMIKLRYLPDKK